LNKPHLKKTMLELTEAELAQAADSYDRFLQLSRPARGEPVQAGDQAQARRAAELAASFDDRVHGAQHKLSRLRAIDFKPRTLVGEGAVVRMNGRNVVVAVSTAQFECDGEQFIGISVDAPIYAALEGKAAGDNASFNGREFQIEQVD